MRCSRNRYFSKLMFLAVGIILIMVLPILLKRLNEKFGLYKPSDVYSFISDLKCSPEKGAKGNGMDYRFNKVSVTANAAHMGNNTTEATCKYHVESVVPNIVHYIWFTEGKVRSLEFLHFISIFSAYKKQKPDRIMFHCNEEPSGEHWGKLKRIIPILEVLFMKVPLSIHSHQISHVFHKGDVAKLEILKKYGGIYLDYDVIVIQSLDPLRHYDFTMGERHGWKFVAGVMIGTKESEFLEMFYESYKLYRPSAWDYNCGVIPHYIYEKCPGSVHVESHKLTKPDSTSSIFYNHYNWWDNYVVHVMVHETDISGINQISIQNMDSTLGEILRYIYIMDP